MNAANIDRCVIKFNQEKPHVKVGGGPFRKGDAELAVAAGLPRFLIRYTDVRLLLEKSNEKWDPAHHD